MVDKLKNKGFNLPGGEDSGLERLNDYIWVKKNV